MADFDIRKNAETIADLFVSFFEQFVEILTKPRSSIVLKLFRAKGILQDTIVVFLVVISSLHLVFIPVISVASHLLSDTKVTLSYDYIVYFGAKSDRRWNEGMWIQDGYNAGRILRMLEEFPDWRTRLSGEYSETFIKEKEPERSESILPPVPELGNFQSPSEVPLDPVSIDRVRAEDGLYGRPKRKEQPVLSGGVLGILFGIWLTYYLINSAYLAIGLSVPHRKSSLFLFAMAVLGPILFVIFVTLMFVGCVLMV